MDFQLIKLGYVCRDSLNWIVLPSFLTVSRRISILLVVAVVVVVIVVIVIVAAVVAAVARFLFISFSHTKTLFAVAAAADVAAAVVLYYLENTHASFE